MNIAPGNYAQYGVTPTLVRKTRVARALRRILVCIAAPVILGHAAFADEHASGHTWSYQGATGPSHWASENPEYAACGVGKRQSPINIVAAQKTPLPSIQFNYSPSPLTIIDNGHTIEVSYAPGSFIVIDGQRYDLVQFHFHRPSEEHVDGRGYSMVAHLVHKNQKGEVAVVAVLLREGKTNAFLDSVWAHIPSDKGHEHAVAGATVNIAELLPAKQGYYTFEGSLTTPPCTEHVKWLVLKSPVELSAAQIGVFAKRYPNNARPLQALNDRVIRESVD
jgi:carbonic anhydrase